ncbi:MAG: hypothetical protein KDK65_06265 [Chlamydiia bacterium]|nr:hypothetical protein [Chlamydiia bacterium]
MRVEFDLNEWQDWTSFSEKRSLIVVERKVYVEEIPYARRKGWFRRGCKLERVVEGVQEAVEGMKLHPTVRQNVKGLLRLIDSHNVHVNKRRAWWLFALLERLGVIRLETIDRQPLHELLIEAC